MTTLQHDDEHAQLRATLAALSVRVEHLEKELAGRSNGDARDTTFLAAAHATAARSTSARTLAASSSAARCLIQPPSLPAEVPMAATRMVTSQLCSPAESNGLGIAMGGAVLSWIDVCAGLAAKTLARETCVTVSVDSVHFLRPVHSGAVVLVAAMVNRTFDSSMEVGVRVEEECPLTGARRHCCSAYLTFVGIGFGKGKPRLPRVTPGPSSRLRAIHAEAETRRAFRLQRRRALQTNPAAMAAEAACRLLPVTHRVGTPTLPPALPRLDFSGTAPAPGPPADNAPIAAATHHGSSAPRVRISPALTTGHTTHIIMPQHANSIGITFGGQVLRWIEAAAFVVASRVSRGGFVLVASMDEVTFLKPTRLGDTVFVEAQATAVFGSSLEVMVSVWGEVPEEGVPFHCGDAYVTVVSVDSSSQPVDIPFEVVPGTPEEERRYQGAVTRRQGRLALREQLLREKGKRGSLDEEVDVEGTLSKFRRAAAAATTAAVSPAEGEEEPDALAQALAEA